MSGGPIQSRNGFHDPTPRRVGAVPYQSTSGTITMIESWSVPGLGTLWYGKRFEKYLTPDGFLSESIDGASAYGDHREVAGAVESYEAGRLVESRAAMMLPGPGRDPVPVLASPRYDRSPEGLRTVVFRSCGTRYQLQQVGPEDWRVFWDGGSVFRTLRNPGFPTEVEAQAAAERHSLERRREEDARHLSHAAEMVAAGLANVRIESGDAIGETVFRVQETAEVAARAREGPSDGGVRPG